MNTLNNTDKGYSTPNPLEEIRLNQGYWFNFPRREIQSPCARVGSPVTTMRCWPETSLFVFGANNAPFFSLNYVDRPVKKHTFKLNEVGLSASLRPHRPQGAGASAGGSNLDTSKAARSKYVLLYLKLFLIKNCFKDQGGCCDILFIYHEHMKVFLVYWNANAYWY